MNNLKGKKILLAITGSIAAYKACELIRLLRLQEADVEVLVTKDACEFVTPLTLQALSGRPVHQALLDYTSEAGMSHIALAKWADLLLVAPATANLIARFSSGVADDLLTTLYLACPAPVVIVPAMNQCMWQHPATAQNHTILLQRGVLFLGPQFGQQACGDIGMGRMLEPSEIISHLNHLFSPKLLSGLNFLITAGPTREPIDPVRYISNHSSGKMGYALAEVATELGAETCLITGPTHLSPPFNVEMIQVETADEMHEQVMNKIRACHIFIAAAAVADYRCATIARQKIKKSDVPVINLKKTPDILMEVGRLENPPFLVGFAAETENFLINAQEKLRKKKLEMIIANLVGKEGCGFHSDFNEIVVITNKRQLALPSSTKKQLARQIIPLIFAEYTKKISG
jgi:phosphopantothenoylcysteine decarboxylase / phosphopantothenate---cysteine ligase